MEEKVSGVESSIKKPLRDSDNMSSLILPRGNNDSFPRNRDKSIRRHDSMDKELNDY